MLSKIILPANAAHDECRQKQNDPDFPNIHFRIKLSLVKEYPKLARPVVL